MNETKSEPRRDANLLGRVLAAALIASAAYGVRRVYATAAGPVVMKVELKTTLRPSVKASAELKASAVAKGSPLPLAKVSSAPVPDAAPKAPAAAAPKIAAPASAAAPIAPTAPPASDAAVAPKTP